MAITQSTTGDPGLIEQALSFPFASDIIRAAANEGCNGLVFSLLGLIAHPGGGAHTLSIAIQALSGIDLGPQKAALVTALLDRLKDNDSEVRVAADQALATIGPGEQRTAVVNVLLDQLKHGDERTVSSAADTLAKIGPGEQKTAVVNALLDQLKHGDKNVVASAADALAKIGPGEQKTAAVIALVDRLKHGDDDGLASAADALAKIGPGEQKTAAVIALVDRLKHGDDDALASATDGLAKIGLGEQKAVVVRALLDRLKDNDPDVRGAAAKALATIGTGDRKPAVVEALLDQLKHGDEDVIALAARAIAKIGPGEQRPTIVRVLLDRLKDDDSDVRQAAAQALATIGPGEQKTTVVSALLDQLKHGDDHTVASVTQALATIGPGEQRTDIVKAIVTRLTDFRPRIREAAAQALATIGPGEQETAVLNALIERLKDNDSGVRIAAAQTNGKLDPDNAVEARTITAVQSLTNEYRPDVKAASILLSLPQSPKAEALALELLNLGELVKIIAPEVPFADHERALVYIMSGGTSVEMLVARLGNPTPEPPLPKTPEKAQPILSAMHTLWAATGDQTRLLRDEIASQGTKIVLSVCGGTRSNITDWGGWLPTWWQGIVQLITAGGPAHCQQPLFINSAKHLRNDLTAGHFDEQAEAIRKAIAADDPILTWLIRASLIVMGYMALWSILMLGFPRSRFVQSVVFFSPKLRKLTSLYISEIFPFLPFARGRLLSPFRKQLGPKEELIEGTTGENWFSDVEVTEPPSEERVQITKALPVIKGLTVLEGASGLGKTAYLIRLARDRKRIVAFLEAAEEDGDVLKAIAARLPGEVMRDSDFLNSLIYAGGLDICVDGLNEASAGARSNIVSFARRMSKGNILIATQPVRWDVPQGRRLLRLQPLRLEQARRFLESREPILPTDALIRGDEYKSAIRKYLDGLASALPADKTELDARDRALSNPMDLSTIAAIIARGGQPDLLNLQEMAFQQAALAYEQINNNRLFPLGDFAEYVYHRRLEPTGANKASLVLDAESFPQECEVLAEHRLLLRVETSSNSGENAKSWIFRHDKILDFFLYQAIASEHLDGALREERMLKHIDDPRFRGVFLLAALRAPLEFAKWLRDRIADQAAESRDPALLYQFWPTVRHRVEAEALAQVERAKAA